MPLVLVLVKRWYYVQYGTAPADCELLRCVSQSSKAFMIPLCRTPPRNYEIMAAFQQTHLGKKIV